MTTGAPTQNIPKGPLFLRYATVPTQSLPGGAKNSTTV